MLKHNLIVENPPPNAQQAITSTILNLFSFKCKSQILSISNNFHIAIYVWKQQVWSLNFLHRNCCLAIKNTWKLEDYLALAKANTLETNNIGMT